MVAPVWLRLLATLLLCLLGTAPVSARRCEPTGPVFEDRAPQRSAARSVRRDGASLAARVQTTDGDDTPPLAANVELPRPQSTALAERTVAPPIAARDAPRGRALPRGPPVAPHCA